MTRSLIVHRTGPGTTIQDLGRTGTLIKGLSQSGAADMTALHEGAALLGQTPDLAALELAGIGGTFEARGDIRIALSGAPMAATIEGERIAWNASHMLRNAQKLTLGNASMGNYGYLHLGGGIDTVPFLGSRSTHLVARIGSPVTKGAALPIGADPNDTTGMTLNVHNRLSGGTIRVIPSVQTAQFAAKELTRLQNTRFTRDPRGNRMGARMNFDGAPFEASDQLNILSEMVVPGDIQITGDGTPFVLLYECQTTGGYPRIATVIPADISIVAQARAGDPIHFQFINREAALTLHRSYHTHLKALPQAVTPLIRDPHDIRDLLSYQLVSGAINGDEEDLK